MCWRAICPEGGARNDGERYCFDTGRYGFGPATCHASRAEKLNQLFRSLESCDLVWHPSNNTQANRARQADRLI